jgi:hypothetical protein
MKEREWPVRGEGTGGSRERYTYTHTIEHSNPNQTLTKCSTTYVSEGLFPGVLNRKLCLNKTNPLHPAGADG